MCCPLPSPVPALPPPVPPTPRRRRCGFVRLRLTRPHLSELDSFDFVSLVQFSCPRLDSFDFVSLVQSLISRTGLVRLRPTRPVLSQNLDSFDFVSFVQILEYLILESEMSRRRIVDVSQSQARGLSVAKSEDVAKLVRGLSVIFRLGDVGGSPTHLLITVSLRSPTVPHRRLPWASLSTTEGMPAVQAQSPHGSRALNCVRAAENGYTFQGARF